MTTKTVQLDALAALLERARAAAKKHTKAKHGEVYRPPYIYFTQREVFKGPKKCMAIEIMVVGTEGQVSLTDWPPDKPIGGRRK